VSLEDDLMRIFGGDRIQTMMGTLGLDDETPIENKLVSRSLESAQKKVEGTNFDTRKHVVEYDDVMNKHRESIYARRRKVLTAENLRDDIMAMISSQASAMVKAHTNERTSEVNFEGLREAVGTMMPVTPELAAEMEKAHPSELPRLLGHSAEDLYDARTEQFTPGLMAVLERYAYITALDRLWIEHLEAMDSLRNGIGLRGIGQRDPLVEYKREGFRMFKQLLGLLDAEVATTIFKLQIQPQAQPAAPVETALTRAAGQARTNAAEDGGTASASEATGSRSERRARERAVAGSHSATKQTNKKRKKRR
jgi:preprotein translocase subunit SecA